MKDYRNKPNKQRRNRSGKEKPMNIREVPQHVWKSIPTPNKNSPFNMSMAEHESFA